MNKIKIGNKIISNDSPNVNGLILAGCADFKTELNQTEMFDRRLKKKIIKILY